MNISGKRPAALKRLQEQLALLSSILLGVAIGIVGVRPSNFAGVMAEKFQTTAAGVAPGIAFLGNYSYYIATASFVLYLLVVLYVKGKLWGNHLGLSSGLMMMSYVIIAIRNVYGGEMAVSALGMFAFSALVIASTASTSIASLLRATVISAIVFVTLNWYQLVMGGGVWQGRAFGVTAHANHLGAYSSIYLTILISLIAVEKRWRIRLILIVVSCLTAGLVYASGSRTAIVTLAGGIISLLFLKRDFKITLAVGIALAVILGVIYVYTHSHSQISVASVTENSDRGNTRADAWKGLWNSVCRSPIFGEGYDDEQYVENSYLLAWSRGGILAFITLIGALTTAAISSFKIKYQTENFLAPALTAIIILGVFEGTLIDKFSPMTFFIAICLGSADRMKVAWSARKSLKRIAA
jgi:hypothetical protein